MQYTKSEIEKSRQDQINDLKKYPESSTEAT